jgi:hypothetical protein
MKTAKIALGMVVTGGILAFLLSWPSSRESSNHEIPTTYDYYKELPTATSIPITHTPKKPQKRTMLAVNNK